MGVPAGYVVDEQSSGGVSLPRGYSLDPPLSVADQARSRLASRGLTPDDVKAGRGLTTPEQIKFEDPEEVNGGFVGGVGRFAKAQVPDVLANAILPGGGPQMLRLAHAAQTLPEHHTARDIASEVASIVGIPDYPGIAAESYRRGEANQSRSDMYGEAAIPAAAAAVGLAAKLLPKTAPVEAPQPRPTLIERPVGSVDKPILYTGSGAPLVDATPPKGPSPAAASPTGFLWRKLAHLIPGVGKVVTVAEIGKAVYESPLFKSTTPSTKSAFANAMRAGDIQRALALSAGFVGGQGLDDQYGHDPAIHAAVDDAFVRANGNPMVARQILHGQEAVYVNPDGSEVAVPGHVVRSFVNALPSTDLQHSDSGMAQGDAQGGAAQVGRQAGVPAAPVGAGRDTFSDMLLGSSANAEERTPNLSASNRGVARPASNVPLPEASSTTTADGRVVDDGSDPVARAKYELAHRGVTPEQADAYRPGVSEALRRAIDPYDNYDKPEELRGIATKAIPQLFGRGLSKRDPRLDDAWRMYLGMPQTHGSFGISDYRPSVEKDKSKGEPYYYKINGWFQNYFDDEIGANVNLTYDEVMKDVLRKIDASPSRRAHQKDTTMNTYQLSRGEDERGPYISLYDRWDLAPGKKMFNAEKVAGRPFEIYDRLYYDPDTLEPDLDDTGSGAR